MIVKICGITNLEDAVAAVEYGANALGFHFYPKSPRYIAPADAARIASALPDGILRVGVFVNEAPAEVAHIARLAGLHIAQLHGDEPADSLPDYSMRVWKAFRVSNGWTTAVLDHYDAEAFLLDGPRSGESFDWKTARGAAKRILVAGGLDADNVALAIREVQPWGVDACSRLEATPGRKDHDKLRRFILAALSEWI